MSKNSFPSMAVSKQTGEIFIVWGGHDATINRSSSDIFILKSTDQGSTWFGSILVNQDPDLNSLNQLGEQWLPWIACDEISNAIVVTYYDTRNASEWVETFISISYDRGITWTDYKLNETNSEWEGLGIPGFGIGQLDKACYAGDYIGVDIYHGRVVPVWSDTRYTAPDVRSKMLAYTHPFDLPCTSDLSLCDVIIAGSAQLPGEAFYTVGNSVTAAGTCGYLVENTGKSTMQAGNEISLLGGFSASGEFHAEIVPVCNTFSQRLMNQNQDIKNQAPSEVPDKWKNIQIIPNPTAGNFSIAFSAPPSRICIFDLSGKTILCKEYINSNQIELSLMNHEAGIYVVKLEYEDEVNI